MFPLSAWHFMCCIVLYQQTPVYLQSTSLTLSVETFPLKCRHSVEFKCQITGATCCDNTARVWTLESGQIMYNGAAINNDKYIEEKTDGSTFFKMKMMNLSSTDFAKDFQCQYAFAVSNTVTLARTKDYECSPTESCTVNYDMHKDLYTLFVEGKVNLSKTAPEPQLYAFYGEDNLTSYISTVQNQYDTWYYSVGLDFGLTIDCDYGRSKEFILTAVTGTTTTIVCKKDICRCVWCTVHCVLISLAVQTIGYIVLISILFIKEQISCSKGCILITACILLRMGLEYFLLTSIINILPAVPFGLLVCPCEEAALWVLIFMISFGTGTFGSLIVCYPRYDWHYISGICTKDKIKYCLLGYISAGISLIIAPAFDGNWFKGTGSKEAPLKKYAKQECEAVLECKDGDEKKEWAKQVGGGWETIASLETIKYKISDDPACFKTKKHILNVKDSHLNDVGIYKCSGKHGNVYYFQLILKSNDDGPLKLWLIFSGLMLLPILVVPIIFLSAYCVYLKGGKSQSIESGSPEKERADKKKERKPTEVVRPQPSRPLPSRAQHLKTDNTGREEYSAENELFKPRPLPSISGHSDSPRPLPKRTPDDQLEKGGIQLEPLVDTTSERKKRRKKKKKETRQSDEDD